MSIKKIIYLSLTLVMALTSCVGIDEGKDSGVGYFTINGFNVDAEVSELLPTKSGETSLGSLSVRYTAPDPSNTIFKVKKGDSVVKEWKGLPSAAIELPKGDYVLEAEFGRNDFGDAWFTGSTEVSIKDADVDSDQPVSASVTLNVANSLVSVSIDDSLREHLAAADVNVTIGSIENAELEKYYFVPVGSGLNVVLQAKNLLEQKKDFSYSMTPQARTAAEVVFRLDGSVETPTVTLGDLSEGAFEGSLYFPPASISSNISSSASLLVYELKTGDTWTPVNVSDVSGYKYISEQPDGSSFKNETTYYLRARIGNVISEEREFTPKSFAECITSSECSADHKYDETVLTGTRVKASVGIALPSIIAELGSVSAAASFKGSDGKERSSKNVALDNENGNNEFDLTNISGWPYIPQGSDYQMTISLTCKIGEMSIAAELTKPDISVPEPEFVVTASAYTSYDKYLAGDLDFANKFDNKYIVFDRKAAVTISQEILTNANYDALRSSSITFNSQSVGTFDAPSKDFGKATDCTKLQNYQFKATMTFDGVTKSASDDCHITGLPYEVDFDSSRREQNNWGWTLNNGAAWGKTSASYWKLKLNGGYIVSPKFHVPSSILLTAYVECQYYKVSSGSSTYSIGPTTDNKTVATSDLGSKSVARQVYTDRTGDRDFTVETKIDANKPYISLTATESNSFVYLVKLTYR